MPKLKLLVLLTLGMEVDSTHTPGTLVETDVVEAFKASSCYRLDAVIRDKEVFFPAHEEVFSFKIVLQCEIW